jgi:putative ABC transport system permease protein
MIKSFFMIALRYLWRKKTYSILNFVCLTFGLTCAILTMMYIRNVFSYDKFHKNYNRLYSVDAYLTYFNGARFPKEYLSASLRDVLRVNAPEIEEITRVSERDFSFINGDKTFTGKGVYADSNFFNVFSFPVIHAVSINVLADMNSVVISERMALKFFNNADCIDKTLILKAGGKQEVFKVSGVFNDVPSQSKLQFDFVIPFTKFLTDNTWALETGSASNGTWVLLKNNINYRLVENKIRNLIKTQETTLNQELFLFPLKEQILYNYAGGRRIWKEMQNIVIIGTIGFAILLIACFNFINLAIALNFRRYHEAGIKKVVGSPGLTIALQYLGETFILTIVSLISALILIYLLLVGFNSMFNYNIQLQLLNIKMLAFLTSVTLFTGLISGIFPALYLASINPIDTLKGKIITSYSYSIFRQSLIIFQFAIPITLIICMIIIKTQDSYMRNYDVGVDKNLIVTNNSKNIQQHAESFRTELLSISGIDAVSFTNCIPTRGAKVSSEVTWQGNDVTEKLHFWCINSDFEYNKTVRVKMVDGRYFNSSFSTDSTAYVINDVAASVMKNKNPVGTFITIEGREGPIIGVFKDFHAIDLAGPLVPTVISVYSADRPSILIRFSSGTFHAISNQIRPIFEHYEKEAPFQATLFRDLIPYSNLSLPSSLVGLAFIIALLMACLGLFGLASFTSETRTKEIGIRKATGATTFSVMGLLLASYTKWLTIASVIALPLAFLFGKVFLGRFNFHTPIPFWAFFAGPLLAAFVALLTVSSQTWIVASRNPVKALRYE